MIILNSFTPNQINKLQKFFNAHGSAELKQILTNCGDELFVEALYLCLLNKIPSNAEIDGDRLLLSTIDREKVINRFHSIRSTSNIPDTVDYPIEKIIPPIIEILPVVPEPTIESIVEFPTESSTEPVIESVALLLSESVSEPASSKTPTKKSKIKSHLNQTNKS